MSTTRIAYASADGRTVNGELALPPGAAKAPAILVLQEFWGVNAHIKGIAERFAAEGYVALAPDLYDGTITTSADEANALLKSFDWPKGVAHIVGAAKHIRTHERASGKVGVVGFCMGGALALVTATAVEELSAAVAFYGVPPGADYSRVKAPILGHFAKKDDWASPDKAEAIKAELAKRNQPMTLHVYDAGHAFFNDTRPEVYSKENAALAWSRTLAFFKEHLS